MLRTHTAPGLDLDRDEAQGKSADPDSKADQGLRMIGNEGMCTPREGTEQRKCGFGVRHIGLRPATGHVTLSLRASASWCGNCG